MRGGDGDNSNSQFALLALHEAERVGVKASDRTWRLAKTVLGELPERGRLVAVQSFFARRHGQHDLRRHYLDGHRRRQGAGGRR